MNRQMRRAWRTDMKRRKVKKMAHYQEFDSIEEAMAAMEEAENRANESVLEEQRAIGFGDYWCRPLPEYGVFEFGRVSTMDEIKESLQHEDEPAHVILAGYEERFERGYRFGKSYSVLGPEGTLGDTHVANMWPISEEEFLTAKEDQWEVREALVIRVMEEHGRASVRQSKAGATRDEAQFEVVEEDDDHSGSRDVGF